MFNNPRATLYPNAATDPAQYAAFLSDTGIWTPSRGHHALSPRLRAAYALSPSTSLRAGYGQQAQLPSFADVFANTNGDLTFLSTNSAFGRDVDYAKTELMELGARHAFGPRVSLDVSLYHKNHIAPFGFRILPFQNPRQASETLSINVLTKVDGGHGTGVDARLDWQAGDVLTTSVAYSFLNAKFGFDSGTFLGSCVGCQPDVNAHALYALANVAVPDGWRAGTTLGALARGLDALVTRAAVHPAPQQWRRSNRAAARAGAWWPCGGDDRCLSAAHDEGPRPAAHEALPGRRARVARIRRRPQPLQLHQRARVVRRDGRGHERRLQAENPEPRDDEPAGRGQRRRRAQRGWLDRFERQLQHVGEPSQLRSPAPGRSAVRERRPVVHARRADPRARYVLQLVLRALAVLRTEPHGAGGCRAGILT
ncbi:MAG: hypothetical protein DMD65_00235 [Gemmatimonadetes bacterium]|nr:MAG: hypothetical protein DMD65_00235 [Gemmatimonadota bacterium]